MASFDITATEEWAALVDHARELRADGVHLRDLFAADPDRSERFTSTLGDLVVDWSLQLVTRQTVELLEALAERAGVRERVRAMLAGDPVNVTEGRPALHTALRGPPDARACVDGADVTPMVQAELARMGRFARAVRAGERLGSAGRPITAVVSIGIGGSHLGPAMACEALADRGRAGVDVRFVSNVDPSDLAAALNGLDPAETLFIVVSKSFATPETLANAAAARAWTAAALGDQAAVGHFAAVTAEPARAAGLGIAAEDTFAMWDWVGGRFSLASASGLALMVAVGEARFAEMLAGMRSIDEHLTALMSAPVLLGLLAVWNRNFLGMPARSVLPYSHRLRLFPTFLQQLEMESNGKRVNLDGSPVGCDTAPIVWGAAGTDGQHSFHQFLHQGTTAVPADFIVFARPDADTADAPDAKERHEALVSNCFAQASALAFGTPARDDPHRELPGNRPSTVIMAPELTPSILGQLVALYEHQTVVQGAVWGINSFDQFGVEHGKTLADAIAADLTGEGSSRGASEHDPSTQSLVAHYRRLSES